MNGFKNGKISKSTDLGTTSTEKLREDLDYKDFTSCSDKGGAFWIEETREELHWAISAGYKNVLSLIVQPKITLQGVCKCVLTQYYFNLPTINFMIMLWKYFSDNSSFSCEQKERRLGLTEFTYKLINRRATIHPCHTSGIAVGPIIWLLWPGG